MDTLVHSIDVNAQSTIVANVSTPFTADTNAGVIISAERLRQLEYIEANYDSIIERAVLDRIESESRNKRVAHSMRTNKLMHKHLSTATT